jgi:serine phosphatase RsbU (regulator of sigma subunit)
MDFDKTVAAAKRSVEAGEAAHYLIGIGGPVLGLRLELSDGATVLGRRPDATIRLDDPAVSGRHCRLSVILDQVIVEDLRSTNGTLLDDEPIRQPSVLPIGSLLQVGNCLFKHELRSRDEVQQEERLAGDLAKAADYVRSLLPLPIRTETVSTSWRFIPSDELGGDAFGYHWLDDSRFAVYLVDVCGHGTAPALHSVSVMNVLRKRSLPMVDFSRPAHVLKALNEAYLMSEHANMYFTAWYGVFDRESRTLSYASAGHPPALLLPLDGGAPQRLWTANLAVGMLPDTEFGDQTVPIAAPANLYLYSDGAFEVVTQAGEEWRLDDFLSMVAETPLEGVEELDRIERNVRSIMRAADFGDDFSLVLVRFS